MPVNRIGTADVMAVLLPIWAEKRETARRVRQRISAVMRWAVAQGYREDNPAGDAIGAALPKTGVRTRHQPALPYPEVRGAMERVRASRAYPSTVLAFEFLVLTACRSGEVRGARWEEMDLEAREWAGPGGTDEDEPDPPGSLVHRGAGGAGGRRAASWTTRTWCSRQCEAAPSPMRRSPRWSANWGLGPCRTVSGRASGTGRRNVPTPPARCASWRWPM